MKIKNMQMKDPRAAIWRRYKAAFLKANHCTDVEFERAYVAFMQTKPSISDYWTFAQQYSIDIYPEPNLPEDVRIVLSVSISAIKVMSRTFEESLAAIKDILTPIN